MTKVTVQERPKLNRRLLDALGFSQDEPAVESSDASVSLAVNEAEAAVDETSSARRSLQETEAHPVKDRSNDEAADEEVSRTEEQATESVLIQQAKRDPAAFGSLYELYVDRIYGYIYHRVGNVQDTEDLTARTFYRALDNIDGYEDRGAPFGAWLFRIAHNLVANYHRDRSRRRFLSLDRFWSHSADGNTPERQVEQDEKSSALWSAIDRLPEDRRNLLLFKFGSQLSNVEIGEMMNKSESAIKSLYFRTLAALRQDLEARGWGRGDDDAHEADSEMSDAGSGLEAALQEAVGNRQEDK